MKFLIVEDNPEMRRLLVKIVWQTGDVIVECADGAEALPAYRAASPDWVVMDLQMPVLDGIGATGEIIRNFPDAKIVIVTDYGSAGLRRAAQDAGAREYIVKENLIELRRLLAH